MIQPFGLLIDSLPRLAYFALQKTMKRLLVITGCCVFLGLPLICGAQQKVDTFDEINVVGNIRVTLVKGDAETVDLVVENIPEDKVSVKVTNGELRMKVLESVFYKNEVIRATVTYRMLRSIAANAGAAITANGPVEGDELHVHAGSGATVEIEVKTENIEAEAGEGGVLTLSGTTGRQEASSSTGGKYQGFNLECRRTYARANTGGITQVFVSEYLEASANTGGNVIYKGDPKSTSMKTVLSGKVEKL